jgi:hypothetical protein
MVTRRSKTHDSGLLDELQVLNTKPYKNATNVLVKCKEYTTKNVPGHVRIDCWAGLVVRRGGDGGELNKKGVDFAGGLRCV